METNICIYCRRTLELSELLEKAGKYRCKDENKCLEYQTREDPANSVGNTDYISDLVKSSLIEARQRIATYKRTKDHQTNSSIGDNVKISEESIAEFTWMKSVVDVLASEYKENNKFVFQYDETKNNEYKISFNHADNNFYFTVKIDSITGSRYSLIVAKEDIVANKDPLYEEFIYKSFPSSEREDVIKDLSVILIAFKEETDLISALLTEFRMEIESRSYNNGTENY
ncbi:MAG: hypothetical protein L6300_06460 [Syntrophaceae bacterium]|nr:hypothetical protein [Pseudomonadota bacterium]MCG2739866.1 hypothetical protein [Syntrophaceae bacterium]